MVYNYSVDHSAIEIGDILQIYEYLMKKHNIKQLQIYQILLLVMFLDS